MKNVLYYLYALIAAGHFIACGCALWNQHYLPAFGLFVLGFAILSAGEDTKI